MLAFSALADPTRFRIIEMLASNGCLPVNQISSQFKVSAPAISQHLKILKDANLVKVEIKAQQRIYTINPDGICEIEQWISKMQKMWHESFDRLDILLKEEVQKLNLEGKKDD